MNVKCGFHIIGCQQKNQDRLRSRVRALTVRNETYVDDSRLGVNIGCFHHDSRVNFLKDEYLYSKLLAQM